MLTIQSHVATIGGYIKPSIHDNETIECAVLNSLSFSLEKHNNLFYYRGKRVYIKAQQWDKDTGVLSIIFEGDSIH